MITRIKRRPPLHLIIYVAEVVLFYVLQRLSYSLPSTISFGKKLLTSKIT